MFRSKVPSKLIVPALAVVCLLGSQVVVPTATLAAPMPAMRAIVVTAPPSSTPVSGKMVHLNLANSTSSSLDIKVGDTPVTLAAGETVKITAPTGVKVIVVNAITTHEAGSVLAQVSPEMSGATIHVN